MSHIVIDEKKCKSCYLCIEACPKGLIKKSEIIGKTGQYVVHFEDEKNECLACTKCALVCPDLAIKEIYKNE